MTTQPASPIVAFFKKAIVDLFKDVNRDDFVVHMESYASNPDPQAMFFYMANWKEFLSKDRSSKDHYSLFNGKLSFKDIISQPFSFQILEKHFELIKLIVDHKDVAYSLHEALLEFKDGDKIDNSVVTRGESHSAQPLMPVSLDLNQLCREMNNCLKNQDVNMLMKDMSSMMSSLADNPQKVLRDIEQNDQNNPLFNIVNKFTKAIPKP